MKKYRLHIIGIPHTKTNLDYTTCAFTQKAYKFCKMMHDRGHYVVNYGVEGSNPECDENVSVVSNEIYEKVYGKRDSKKFFDTSQNNECYATFYLNTIKELEKRKQPGDIALAFWGCGIQTIIDAHKDMIWIHPGIGYDNPLEENIEFRVFESNALRSEYYGKLGVSRWRQTDRVIPNYFDANDFEYKDETQKDDYFLYLGRIYDTKGMDIILDVVKKTGIKLKVAGQLSEQYLEDNYIWPENVEYVGLANVEKRKKLMANAKGSFLMARYLEPFGGVQIENFLSGTPMITSDAGCYPETNPDGLTGYCCANLQETIDAVRKIQNGEIKSENCRKWGERYLLENVAPQFEDFFDDCTKMHYGGDLYKENTKPFFSIIVPFYNSEKLIRPLLNSIASQTFKNFEVIMIDDCSTDNTYKIVNEYLDKIPNLRRYKHNVNKKTATTRNEGIDLSRGEYIWFIDSDDYICTPDALSDFYNKLRCNKVDIMFFDNDVNGSMFKSVGITSYSNKEYLQSYYTEAPWNRLFRKNFLLEYNIRYVQYPPDDIVFHYKAMKYFNTYLIDDSEKMYIHYTGSHCDSFYNEKNLGDTINGWKEVRDIVFDCDSLMKRVIAYASWFKEFVPEKYLDKVNNILDNKKRKKVVCFGDCGWAIGRIYNALSKYLDNNKYEVDLYDWKDYNNFKRLFFDGHYKNYDCIIVQNTIKEDYEKIGINYDWSLVDNKTIAVSHTYPDYEEPKNYLWSNNYALGKYNVEEHEKVSDKKFGLLYSGYDSDIFLNTRNITQIKSIGFCGNPENAQQCWLNVKRPCMLEEIALKSNCSINFIFGKDNNIYDDIDMYVCTSTLEAGPLGILECAACGIPVISTNVGYAKEIESIKKFESVDEAVEIINYFNSHPDELVEYTETLRKEVEEKFSYNNVIKYWEDAINNVINNK